MWKYGKRTDAEEMEILRKHKAEAALKKARTQRTIPVESCITRGGFKPCLD